MIIGLFNIKCVLLNTNSYVKGKSIESSIVGGSVTKSTKSPNVQSKNLLRNFSADPELQSATRTKLAALKLAAKKLEKAFELGADAVEILSASVKFTESEEIDSIDKEQLKSASEKFTTAASLAAESIKTAATGTDDGIKLSEAVQGGLSAAKVASSKLSKTAALAVEALQLSEAGDLKGAGVKIYETIELGVSAVKFTVSALKKGHTVKPKPEGAQTVKPKPEGAQTVKSESEGSTILQLASVEEIVSHLSVKPEVHPS